MANERPLPDYSNDSFLQAKRVFWTATEVVSAGVAAAIPLAVTGFEYLAHVRHTLPVDGMFDGSFIGDTLPISPGAAWLSHKADIHRRAISAEIHTRRDQARPLRR